MQYAIGIGANLGDPEAQVRQALERLARDFRLVARSSLYRSAPWGVIDQPDFVNAAALIETDLDPAPVLARLKAIERELGRVPGDRWGPRRIDLDILLAGDRVMAGSDLVVPHPQLHVRAFALAPLVEIAPTAVHPGLARPLVELLAGLPAAEREGVVRLEESPRPAGGGPGR